MPSNPDLVSTVELENALHTLKVALDFANQNRQDEIRFKIARDACIQRFEYCIELSWKVSMKKLGSQTKFAKPAIREMARADLIQSPETWLDFIEARNSSSHSYDEDVAQRVFTQIERYHQEALNLIKNLQIAP